MVATTCNWVIYCLGVLRYGEALLSVQKTIDSFPSVEENKKKEKKTQEIVSIIVFMSFYSCSGEQILSPLLANRRINTTWKASLC